MHNTVMFVCLTLKPGKLHLKTEVGLPSQKMLNRKEKIQ